MRFRWSWRAFACALGLAAGLGLAGSFRLRAHLATPVAFPAEGIAVRIETGWPLWRIARRLQQAGVVRSRWALVGLARWRGVERQLRAGDYLFTGAATPDAVLEQLRLSSGAMRMVTITEGRTAREVMALLAEAGFGGVDAFQCAANSPLFLLDLDLPESGIEGYLFPDTYAFSRRAAPEEILRAMVERHRLRTAPLADDRERLGLSEPEMVTLASLIEMEAARAAERPLISAVFHNRLRLGMSLQSDPTAVYERPDFRGPISRADLQVPSRYNTYQHAGLPPGPIANPGLAAIEAAVRPAQVPYLYFVSRHDGTHEFSTNLADHNRAVARYSNRGGGP